MSTIDPTTRAAASSGGTPAPAKPTGVLGKDDFLKLLVGQMRNQNPMQPTGDNEWISQMTQFSVLEQITNVATQTTALTDEQRTTRTLALIGKTVTYLDDQGAAQTGAVERVTLTSDGPRLTIGGHAGITPDAIAEVQ
ncbi:MAG: flagellar hook capping FlgD N-terminal domain-containing protein [Solirubrobacteraceae bacterium]